MKHTLLFSCLLAVFASIACSDSSADSDERIGTPGPAIGISAGLDPTLSEGDDFGGLAGAVARPYGTPSVTNSSPSSLPRLQMDSSCNFWEGGRELGRNGASVYTAESSGAAVQAFASNAFQMHDNNTRITIDFEGDLLEPSVHSFGSVDGQVEIKAISARP